LGGLLHIFKKTQGNGKKGGVKKLGQQGIELPKQREKMNRVLQGNDESTMEY